MLKEIHLLARYAPRLLPEYYNPDCCIAATAIVIDVLAEFKIKAAPFPAKPMVFNKPFADIILERGEFVSIEEALKINPAAHSVGIGWDREQRPDGYNAHLAVLVEGKIILDLTITQVSRPQHGMNVAPLVITPPESFLKDMCGGPEHPGKDCICREEQR